MGFKGLCMLGIVLNIMHAEAQWPSFDNGVVGLPCASPCISSALQTYSQICFSSTNPPSTWPLASALPSCISSACPASDYSSFSFVKTNFPYTYTYTNEYPTSVCQALSGSANSASPTSAAAVTSSGVVVFTAKATSTNTDDSAEVLITSVISGSVTSSSVSNAGSTITKPMFFSRSGSGGLLLFVCGIMVFL